MWVFGFGGQRSTVRGETLTFDHKNLSKVQELQTQFATTMAWHLPPFLTMFNVYLFIPYLGNI